MNLHRSSATPDWITTTPSNRNIFQKIAARTNGLLTPGNIITIIGFGVVIYGLTIILYGDFWLGLILLAVGRILDILDGIAADRTGTKSYTGEIFDAAADKIGTILTIVVLLLLNTTHWWVIAALIIPQIIIPIVIFYKKQKGISVHPTRAGKLSMAFTWAGIVGLLISYPLATPWLLMVAVYIVTGLSLMLGMYALWQYATGRD